MSESPASSPYLNRPFDFGDLGRPRPSSARALPQAPAADATGELDVLDADDILETNDIDAFEAAAAGIRSFAPASEPKSVPASVASAPAAAPVSAPAPQPEPSGFEVGDLDSFDDIEVEGVESSPIPPSRPAPPSYQPPRSPQPSPAAVIVRSGIVRSPAVGMPTGEAAAYEPANVRMKVEYAAPPPTTLMGMPPAPITSPLPLESVIVDDAFPEKTLEIPTMDANRASEVAAQLDKLPEQTEVLVRSAMPEALRGSRATRDMTPIHTPAPAPVQANQTLRARPSSIAPVALDVARSMPPAHMPRRTPKKSVNASAPMSGLAIGALVFGVVGLIGLVGVGGFVATRALAEKPEAVAAASQGQSGSPAPVTTEGAPAFGGSAPVAPAFGAANEAPPAAAPGGGIDVSALPSAPTRGAPRGFNGSGFTGTTSAPLAPAAPAPVAAAAPAERSERAAGSRAPAGGTALAAPGVPVAPAAPAARGGNAATAGTAPPLAAPVAAAAPAAAAPAAAAPAAAAGTGVIRVDPKLRAVIVDGSYRRADDGAVTVSCGRHKVKAGMNDVQTVDVPCGGSASL